MGPNKIYLPCGESESIETGAGLFTTGTGESAETVILARYCTNLRLRTEEKKLNLSQKVKILA